MEEEDDSSSMMVLAWILWGRKRKITSDERRKKQRIGTECGVTDNIFLFETIIRILFVLGCSATPTYDLLDLSEAMILTSLDMIES
jgi:hypothetical protein